MISSWHFLAPTLFLHGIFQLLYTFCILQHPLYLCMAHCSIRSTSAWCLQHSCKAFGSSLPGFAWLFAAAACFLHDISQHPLYFCTAFYSCCMISARHFAAPTLFLHRVCRHPGVVLLLHGIMEPPAWFTHGILELLLDFCAAFCSNCLISARHFAATA